MIGIVDYGMGNLKSVIKALEYLGFEWNISSKKDELKNCDKLIIPGVGAFNKAMENINKLELKEFLKSYDKPVLGICLGMQILFEGGYEDGYTEGLGLINGNIIHIKEGLKKQKLDDRGVKTPHMGWNMVNGKHYYFVHSYYADCEERYVTGYADYYIKIPGTVRNNNAFGCQFHPEKSGKDGLEILRNFGEKGMLK